MKRVFSKMLLIRVLIVSSFAILILLMFIIVKDVPFERARRNLRFFIPIYILIFNLASEGNIAIDKYFDKKMPWFYFARKRLLIQIPIALIWTSGIAFISAFSIRYAIYGSWRDEFPVFALFALVREFFALMMFNGVILAYNFFNNWKESFLEIEKLKQEKLKSDYKLLQDQINPHFLFNSFNVLISEINHDTKIATEFARKLSQVYRYVLQSKDHEIVKLKDEMNFIESFIYLHKIRIGESLSFETNVNQESFNYSIPPLTLQILVENAIKHNTVNTDYPLNIAIESRAEASLVVKNNLNPKAVIESTKTGLTNIKNRYRLLGDYEIEVENNNSEFVVTIPLIDE